MKKNESTSSKSELKQIKFFIICITLMGSILGSLYSVYINSNDLECTTAVYTWFNESKIDYNFSEIITVLLKNFKKIILIWLFSFFSITYIISYIVIFCNILAYAFTATTILLVLGLQSIWIMFLVCGVQALISVGLGVNILIKKKKVVNKIDYRYVLNEFVEICFFILVLSFYDIISLNILSEILPQIL